MKPIYLFFNYAHDEAIPSHDYWLNFKNPDSTKLAFFCAESWRRNGWEPIRYTTKGVDGFKFTGRLAESAKLYNVEFFNSWFVLRNLAPCWAATIDVFNYGFSPDGALAHERLAVALNHECITFQNQHFSTSLLWVTRAYCEQAIDICNRYDQGEFEAIRSDLVSDETVLRHNSRYMHVPLAKYSIVEPGWETAPLLHCPRSVLQHYKNQPTAP